MSAKKKNEESIQHNGCNAPETLSDCTFFKRLSFDLEDEQIAFRDAIYDKNNYIVMCNARAGSSKTTIAIATACCMVELGLYDEILYCFSLNNGFQNSLGLLPGSQQEKEEGFYEPCCQALVECGYFPAKVIKELASPDNKTAFVSCKSHTFFRGININERTILIIDEAQLFYFDELKKVLTRVKDGAKVIVIGHTGQNDIVSHPERSGFQPYLDYFKDKEHVAVCELKNNYRGWVSRLADDLFFNPTKYQGDKKDV